MKRVAVMRFGSLWTVCSVWFKLASASFSSEYLWSDLTSRLLCLLKPTLDISGSDGHTLWSLLPQQLLKSLGLLRDSGECYFSNEMNRTLRSNVCCFTLADWGAQACNLQMGIGTSVFHAYGNLFFLLLWLLVVCQRVSFVLALFHCG